MITLAYPIPHPSTYPHRYPHTIANGSPYGKSADAILYDGYMNKIVNENNMLLWWQGVGGGQGGRPVRVGYPLAVRLIPQSTRGFKMPYIFFEEEYLYWTEIDPDGSEIDPDVLWNEFMCAF